MDNPILWVVVALVVLGGVYFAFIRKPDATPQLTDGEDDKKLPGSKAGKKDGPTLADKLDKRHEEMAEPKKLADKKPEPKEPKAKTKEESKPEPKPKDEAKKEKEPVKAESKEPAAKPEPSPEAAKKPEAAPAKPAAEEKKPAKAAARTAERALQAKTDVEGMRRGLEKARGEEGFFGRLVSLVSGRKDIDPALVDELEEVLLTSDVGAKTTEKLLSRIRERLEKNELSNPEKVWEALREEAINILTVGESGFMLRAKPTVVMMVGVNGAGKTTTIGKLATKLKAEGREVVLAAGDTFRAAAVQQLKVWGKRVGCEVVKGKDGADPSAVLFDAVKKGVETNADVVLADTAGRLQTKTPLMDELKKIAKSMAKAMDGAPHETLLVLDATNGQNALSQAAQFQEALPLSGLVLTKLDGTAKGGVILAVCDQLQLPVRYIGLGERADDLHEFTAEEFVEALFGEYGR
jgi:fused signal recognition particle receptor